QIVGLLQNVAGIHTKGSDLNIAYHTRQTRLGRFGITWNSTWLEQYDVLLPNGVTKYAGTEQGSPTQAFPRFKSVGILDSDLRSWACCRTSPVSTPRAAT